MIIFYFLAELFLFLTGKKIAIVAVEAKENLEKEMVAKVLEEQDKGAH